MSPEHETDPLFEDLYEQLRSIAGGLVRGGGAQTLTPTVLVNEAYLRLAGKDELRWEDRNHFLRVACKVLRHVLLEYARRKNSLKRGSNWLKVTLNGVEVDESNTVDYLDLEEALAELEALDERKARIVELKYLCGLENAEVADSLNVSKSTVEADWRFSRAWLSKRLASGSSNPQS